MEAFLVDGWRTAIGGFGGSLLPLRATELASPVAAAVLDRCGLSPADVEMVIAGSGLGAAVVLERVS